MIKKEEAKPNIQQMSDYSPAIVNCSGRLKGAKLHGKLTRGEIKNVQDLPIARDIRKQEAVSKKYHCPTQGGTEIAYFPAIRSIVKTNPIIVIQALCLNTACKHNLGSPVKKYL